MSWKGVLYYFIYIVIAAVLIFIISRFTSEDNAGLIFVGILGISLSIYGFFSFRRNLRILKYSPSEKNIPQDLIINGVRFHMTVGGIAWLKVIFLTFFFSIILFLDYTFIQAPERKRQHEIEVKSSN